MTIGTIGHSTHPIEEFIRMLQAHGVRRLVDVRTIPKSRRNPQFNQESLAASLQAAGIDYRHLPGLGGLRHARKDSINSAWRNASFRGYADYMQTPDFTSAIDELLGASPQTETTVMCAEAVPWRCHRSLIADALAVRNIAVEDIYYDAKGKSRREPHTLTRFAKVKGERLWYPGESELFADLAGE